MHNWAYRINNTGWWGETVTPVNLDTDPVEKRRWYQEHLFIQHASTIMEILQHHRLVISLVMSNGERWRLSVCRGEMPFAPLDSKGFQRSGALLSAPNWALNSLARCRLNNLYATCAKRKKHRVCQCLLSISISKLVYILSLLSAEWGMFWRMLVRRGCLLVDTLRTHQAAAELSNR